MKNTLVFVNDNISYSFIQALEANGARIVNFRIESQELIKSDFSIDVKISEILNKELQHSYDAIYLPFSLSVENYLEFLGLRIGMHIRLTNSENNDTPLVFFGQETSYEVNKLNKALGSILFTQNVYTTAKVSLNDFQEQLKFIKRYKNSFTVFDFAENIHIAQPASYETHHTITNEWSILRWAKVLGISNNKIENIERNQGSLLYFKYLRALYPPAKTNGFENINFKNEGRILYIDDEKDKGWEAIFLELFKNTDIEFMSFGSDLRTVEKDSQENLLDTYMQAVKVTVPDVVLLDLRLHPEDFKQSQESQDKSGIQLLKRIKEHNKGIQVIVISATNKIWHLEDLQKEQADGFILKEGPEQSMDETFTETAIANLITKIDDALKMKFLIDVQNKCKAIEIFIDDEPLDFVRSTTKNLEIAFELLKKTKRNERFFNHAYLQLFLIIEEFIKLESVFIKGDACYVVNGDTKIKVLELDKENSKNNRKVYNSAIEYNTNRIYQINNSTYNRYIDTYFVVSSLLIYRFGWTDLELRKWRAIADNRNNKAAHPGGLITSQDIIQLLKFLVVLLNPSNINYNTIKGLDD